MVAASRTALSVCCLALGLLACDPPGEGGDAGARPAPERGGERSLDFEGEIVPTSATDIYSPWVSFLVPVSGGVGTSWNGWKLVSVAADGAAVKAGEVVAEFEYPDAEKNTRKVRDNLRRVEAEAAQNETILAGELAALRADAAQKELDAARTAMDLKKRSAVSESQYQLWVIGHGIARFESEAAGRRIAALQARIRAERASHSIGTAAARYYVERIETVLGRFRVTAPHDGVVRHLFMPRLKRTVQAGDNPRGETPFMAIARDEELSARFFVPEHLIAHIDEGARVLAFSPFSDRPLPGAVRRVARFPQELGEARKNPDLPNAQETVYVVVADLGPRPAGLSAGLEIKVRLP